jgi:hypothetical protein
MVKPFGARPVGGRDVWGAGEDVGGIGCEAESELGEPDRKRDGRGNRVRMKVEIATGDAVCHYSRRKRGKLKSQNAVGLNLGRLKEI